MKIAFVIPNLYPPSGNSVTVLRYIREAAKKCDEVILFQSYEFTDKNSYPLNILSQIDNVKVVTLRVAWHKMVQFTRGLPYGFIIHYVYFPIFVAMKRWLNNKILTQNLSGVHGIYAFDFVDSDIFPNGSPPVIVGTHNQKMGPLKAKAINDGIFLRKASGIRLFDSERKYAETLKNKKVKIIPKGVDTNLFTPRDSAENPRIRFLFVARLEPRKGLDILLESWKMSNVQDRAELHIVGEGRLSYMVKNQRDKSIVYHGPIYDEELASAYRNSDVFIFPTEWDAQPTVIVEAIASGLYTLCSDYMKDVYDDFQRMGYLQYIRNSSENFSFAIKETVNHWEEDFDRRKSMHLYVEQNRSQSKELDMILSFISELYKDNMATTRRRVSGL